MEVKYYKGGRKEMLPLINVFIDLLQIHFLIFLQILPLEMRVFVCHIPQQKLLIECIPVWVRSAGLRVISSLPQQTKPCFTSQSGLWV